MHRIACSVFPVIKNKVEQASFSDYFAAQRSVSEWDDSAITKILSTVLGLLICHNKIFFFVNQF